MKVKVKVKVAAPTDPHLPNHGAAADEMLSMPSMPEILLRMTNARIVQRWQNALALNCRS